MKNYNNYFKIGGILLYITALLPFICVGQSGGIGNPTIPGQSPQDMSDNMKKIVPAAPSVASLMRLEEIPVDNYTGTPSITVPLHSFELDRGLSLDVGLSYSSTGIRVDEIPGWTGAGWSLNCGGSISRTMLDRPDDRQFGQLLDGFETFPQLDKWHSEEWLWNANKLSWDTEPDLFQFNFMGKTGRFILRKDVATDNIIVEDLSGEGVRKITVSMGPKSILEWKILAFKIVDDMGYIYSFDQADFTHSMSPDQSLNEYYNSAWHLSKIETPDHRLLCSFAYQSATESYITPKSYSYNEKLFKPIPRMTGLVPFVVLPPVVANFSSIDIAAAVLGTVTIPGRGSLSFTIASGRTQPFDDPFYHYEGYKLNSVAVKNAEGTVIKNFVFNMRSGRIDTSGKMFLGSIDEIYAPNKKYTYTMLYKDGEIPKYGSPNKDYWGYYNGADNQYLAPMLGADREVNLLTVANGVLESIDYSNGGTKKFTFAPNEFSYIGKRLLDPLNPDEFPENRQFNDVSVNYTSSAVPQSSTITVENDQWVDFRLAATAYSHTYPYLKNDIAGTDLRVTLIASGGFPVTGQIAEKLNIADCSAYGSSLSQQNIIEVTQCSRKIRLQPGTYRIELTQSTGYLASQPVSYTLDYSYFHMAAVAKRTMGGGLRIVRTDLKDADGIKSMRYYTYDDLDNPLYSTGSQSMVAKKVPYYLSRSLFAPSTLSPPGDFFWDPRYLYRVFDDQSGLDIPLSKGNYVTYKNVTVREGEPRDNSPLSIPLFLNGRAEYTYTSMQDFDDNGSDASGYAAYPYLWPLSYDYKRGLLKKKEVYDNGGNLLSRESYDYYYHDQVKEFGFAMKQKWDCDCPVSPTFTHYEDLENYILDYYLLMPGYTPEQARELYNIERNRSEFSLGHQDINDCFFTRRYNWLLSNKYVVGWASIREKKTESFHYDNTGTPAIVTQQDNYVHNVYNQQLMRQTTIPATGETLISEYYYPVDVSDASSLPGGQLGSTDVAVFNTMKGQNHISVPVQTRTSLNGVLLETQRTLFGQLGSSGFTFPRSIQVSKGTGTLEERFSYSDVDSSTGNVLETRQDLIKTYYVWGYRNKLPIAQIECPWDQVLPYDLFNAASVASNVTGQPGLPAALQAIRSALPGAIVTTYTHIPWVGPSSVSDSKGYTIYYDYDEFFRLKTVKDKDASGNTNILSTNNYHYSTEQ